MMKLIQPLSAIVFTITVNMYPVAALADKERGLQLYENHCQECHADNVHTREDRLVTSIPTLRAWVMSWSAHAGPSWTQTEVEDVVDYLNSRFYFFTE